MLKIYTNIEYAKKDGYTVESDIDAMFSLRSDNIANQYIDSRSVKILQNIEGMTSRNKDRIIGKFGDVSLWDISTGGKGCLLAINYTDFIIVADQLGENCLKLLLDLGNICDITIVYNEPLYIFDGYTVMIDDMIVSGYEASKAMEDSYYANANFEEIDNE